MATGRKIGKGCILFVWIVTGVTALILAALVFVFVEARYFVTEGEDIVSIVRPSGYSEELGKNKGISRSYIVRFSSGEESTVNFGQDIEFSSGDKVKITYSKTKFTKTILLKHLEKM